MKLRVACITVAWAAILVLMCQNAACTNPDQSDARSLEDRDAQRTKPPRFSDTHLQPREKGEMDALVEKLAISQAPASFQPVYTPSRDTPASDPRVVAFEAAEQLKACGKAAFPNLLEHLGDGRQSVAFRRMLPATVGLACFTIIEQLVYGLPADYRGSFYRDGADGQLHDRVLFLKPGMFDQGSAADWLAARERKSLTEIQVEALEWLISQEEHIGFPTEQDREDYLYPLERQRNRLLTQLRDAEPD